MATLLLRNGRTPTGDPVDIRCRDGRVHEVGGPLALETGDEVVDLDGRLVLPAAAEPHAHLDKAFLAERIENPSGDLLGAIRAMEAGRHLLTVPDIEERAERAALVMLGNGVTAVRTHADVTLEHGLRSVEALVAVRERLLGTVDIQVVALTGWPVTGRDGSALRSLLDDAVAMGVDVIGGVPHLDDRPEEANEVLLGAAEDAGLPVDLHTDETLDPSALALEHLADIVLSSGFPHAVTASHCVSLGVQDAIVQARVAEKVAAAGIGVVALPHTNLFLQGRDAQSAMPRGVTAVKALREAGVTVAAGADNLQDPFNPVGRADPLETAGLMIMAAHVLPQDAYAMVSGHARSVMGLDPAGVHPGQKADLVALRATTVRDAIAWAAPDRVVVHAGRLVRTVPTTHG